MMSKTVWIDYVENNFEHAECPDKKARNKKKPDKKQEKSSLLIYYSLFEPLYGNF